MACSRTDAILSQLSLRGEDVVRRRSGRVVVFKPNRRGYGAVHVLVPLRGRSLVGYHCVKFCLAHGWLPPVVDHRDGNPWNCALGNLRAATRQENNRNTGTRSHNIVGLKGVSRNKKRFSATLVVGGRRRHLGTFDTAEQAHEAYAAAARVAHGEFYRET